MELGKQTGQEFEHSLNYLQQKSHTVWMFFSLLKRIKKEKSSTDKTSLVILELAHKVCMKCAYLPPRENGHFPWLPRSIHRIRPGRRKLRRPWGRRLRYTGNRWGCPDHQTSQSSTLSGDLHVSRYRPRAQRSRRSVTKTITVPDVSNKNN